MIIEVKFDTYVNAFPSFFFEFCDSYRKFITQPGNYDTALPIIQNVSKVPEKSHHPIWDINFCSCFKLAIFRTTFRTIL